MKFLRETFIYLKKAFWVAIIVALLPAILFAVFLKPVNILTFLPSYYNTFITGAGDIFSLLFKDFKWDSLLIYPLLLLVMQIYYSVSLAMIEKHMRTGKLTAKKLMYDLNNNFISTFATLLFFVIVYILISILLSSLLTLLHTIISPKVQPKMIECIYATILAFIAFVVLIRSIIDILFWGPVMQVYGYSFKDAIIETSHITDKNTFSIFIGIFVPYLIAALIVILVNYIPVNGAIRSILEFSTNLVIYVTLLLYMPAFIMNTLFEVTELERRDKFKLY